MSESLGERVRRAREAAGLSQAQLADAIGIRQPSLHAIETGKSERSKHASALARALRVSLAWLETGKGAMKARGPTDSETLDIAEAPQPMRMARFGEERIAPREWSRDVPVLGSAACGQDGLFEFNGDVLEYARRPPRLIGAQNVYALYVANDSMFPWRKHGELVYAHPGWPVRVEDFVVVQLLPKKEQTDPRPAAYIKQLVRQNSESVTLHQFNPAKDISLKRREIKSLHRIVDWAELLGI